MSSDVHKTSATSSPPAQAATTPDRSTMSAFALMILLGGGASVAIRFTYLELAPFWSATLRFFWAAVILWGLVFIRKVEIPRGGALSGAILFGALSVGASFIFINWGLVKTPASLYQTTAAIVPLLTLFFASLHGLEQLHMRGMLGALLAVVGIAIAFSGSLFAGTSVSLPHLLAIIIGAACLAEAGVVAKLIPRSQPLATNAVAMTVGATMQAAVSLLAGEQWALPTSQATWLALLYLIVGVSVGVFILYLFVLGRWTASGTSYVFVLFPVVTVILATWLAGETISWMFVAGGALVLGGVWIGALYPRRPKSAPVPMSEEPQAYVTPTGCN